MTDTEILDRLLKLFTYSNYDRRGEDRAQVLQFMYKEGVGVWDLDADLELAMLERMRTKK